MLRIQSLSSLAALLCVPLLFSTVTRDQFELPKLIALSLWASPLVLGRLLDPIRRRPTALEGAFFLLLLVQTVTSLPGLRVAYRTSLIGEYENFGGLATTLALAAWFYGLGRGLPTADLEKMSFFAVTAGILSALYALAQMGGLDFLAWDPNTYNASRVFAGLGNPNFLSAYLAMALPLHLAFAEKGHPSPAPSRPIWLFPALLLGLALLGLSTAQGGALLGLGSADRGVLLLPGALGLLSLGLALTHPLLRVGPMAAWGGGLLLAFGLVSTASRGGWLGALVGFALYLILRREKRSPEASPEKPSRLRSSVLWAGAVCLLLLLVWGRPFFERLADSSLHPLESLNRSRLTIWKPAVKMLQANPWHGVGLDCFKIVFPQYSAYDFNDYDGVFVSSRTAHNEWLQAAATSGVPGLLALALLVGCFLLRAVRSLRAASGAHRAFYAAVLAAGAAYLVQNLFSFGVAATLLLWVLLLAAVNRPAPTASPSAPHQKGFLLALALSSLCALPITHRLSADLHFSRGMRALDYLNGDSRLTAPQKERLGSYALGHCQEATALFPLDVKYRLYAGQALEAIAAAREEGASTWEEALAVYRSLSAMSPKNPYYANNEGRVLWALARTQPQRLLEAEEAQARAAALSPENPFFLTQWGATLLALGRSEDAQAPLRKAFNLNAALSAKALCQAATDAYLAKRKDAAFRILDQAATFHPRSPEAWFFKGYLLRQEGRLKEAKTAMAKALELNPRLGQLDDASK